VLPVFEGYCGEGGHCQYYDCVHEDLVAVGIVAFFRPQGAEEHEQANDQAKQYYCNAACDFAWYFHNKKVFSVKKLLELAWAAKKKPALRKPEGRLLG
jgi:hypothetical protein